jgi:eukaryotic-like serine/threonine-protein kinase
MMPEREQRIDELFAQAVELPPADWEKFLAEREAEDVAAGSGVLDRVRALLTNYRQAESEEFLNQPFKSAERAQTLKAGQEFEGYRILQLIAEGGMGEVYLAEDKTLKRKLAIKLIKGHATKDILRRFQTERRILANLQHPNIAQLYEAGATDDGLPFFAMEYVEGQSIDQFIRDQELSLNDRLQLFRTVCSAVSYAHQKLVIHRDLKPGNVFVSKTGEVKLLDFGIAKLLQEGDAEPADATASQFMALTPQYASPEQVKGEPITTASDVYSLGVLLYELLTGQRPYNLKRQTADEITRAICEQEPTKPSSVRTNAEIGEHGDTETNQISASARLRVPASALRGDLDNIVLKALRKEPERRYLSVEQFSEDIRRHLEGLPVSAHKGTFAYRATKFVKRNKLAVAATALIVLTLAAGIIATTIQARRANRRFNQVRQLAHSVLFDYHDAIAALPGSTKVRERLVKDALQYLDNLSTEAGSDVSLLRELALAYEKVASVQGGASVMVKAYGRSASSSNLGDTQGALASMRKALTIRERLAALEARNRDLQNELAYCYEGLANLHTLAGPPEKVLEYANKAIPILEASLATDPTNEDVRLSLGSTYILKAKAMGNPATANLGDIKGALDLLGKAQAMAEKLAADYPTDPEYQRTLGVIYNQAGSLAAAGGDLKQGLEFNFKAIAVDQRLVDLEPNNTLFKTELAIQEGNAGSSMIKLGDTAGALEKFKQALAIYESVIAADPNDAATRRNAGVGYRNIGVAIGTDNRAEALKNFSKALEIFAGLAAKDASNGDFRRQWALTYLGLSRFQLKANDLNSAVDNAQQGIKIDEVLVAASPTNAGAHNTLAQLYRQLGDSYAALGGKGSKQQWSAAKDAYQKALEIYQDMKSKGTLSGADAGKPDELAKEIAKCDEALTK